MQDYNEEPEEYDDEIGLNTEEENLEEEEPQPKKRRVVGLIRRSQIQQNRPPLPREIQNRQEPEYIPEPQYQQPVFYPNERQFQRAKPSPMEIAKEQAQVQILFQQEMEREQRRQARREYLRSRPNFGEKLKNVANRAVMGDEGQMGQVGANFGRGLFRRPNVELPTSHPVKKAVASRFNTIINNIAPKISPMVTSVSFKSKKKSRK